MVDHNLGESSEGWSIVVLGIRFVEGTVSNALISALSITLYFIFFYWIFRLLRLRWGPPKSLFITLLLLHIIPAIILWTTKYALQQ